MMLGSVHVLFQCHSSCTCVLLMFTVGCTGLRWLESDAVVIHCSQSGFTMILKYIVYRAYAQAYAPLWSCTLNSLQVDLRDCTSMYVCMKVQS